MNCIQLGLFVLQLVLVHSAQSKKICNLADTECTTLGAYNVYKPIVSGIQGVFETSDPLHLDEIKEELPTLKYRLSNATLAGMTRCQVTLLKLNDEELSYQYDIICPELVLHHNFYGSGYFGETEIDGTGAVTITLSDYVINFNGHYGKFISEKDQKLHFFITSHEAKFDRKGQFLLDIQGPLHSDKAKFDLAKVYNKEHLDIFETTLKSPLLESYMAIFMKNADAYLRTVPLENILVAV